MLISIAIRKAVCSLVALGESELQSALQDATRLPASSAHTYLYARSLLTAAAAKSDQAHVLRRIMQELSKAATEMSVFACRVSSHLMRTML